MSLRDVVANAVAVAQRVTVSLQVDVSVQGWKGDDGFGGDDLSPPKTYKAIYIQKQKQVKDFNGNDVMASAYLAFLQPIEFVTPNAGVVRRQPLDPRDVLSLPDGLTAPPILAIEGLVDPQSPVAVTAAISTITAAPYYAEVWLG